MKIPFIGNQEIPRDVQRVQLDAALNLLNRGLGHDAGDLVGVGQSEHRPQGSARVGHTIAAAQLEPQAFLRLPFYSKAVAKGSKKTNPHFCSNM